MATAHKRLLVGVAFGFTMAAVVWLNVSEASPLYSYLMQQPRIGHTLLVANLPALFLSRVVSGTPPSTVVVLLACFMQWFALGVGLSFALWRSAAQQAVPGDVAASRRRA